MRLQKYLAQCGVASRRKCEDYITQGRVTINGRKAQIGDFVVKDDTVKLDGKVVRPYPVKLYFIFNKPSGVITSVYDPQGRPTVMDYFSNMPRIFPVGRLDYETEGLLIMTNDGEFANRLMHPRYRVKKRYHVWLDSPLTTDDTDFLMCGVKLDGKLVVPDRVCAVDKNEAVIDVHDGVKREVRRLFAAIGKQVLRLRREAVGSLTLDGLKPCQFRQLTSHELETVKKSIQLFSNKS